MATIAFIAPAPLKGSGGVFRIYNFANVLISLGHTCDIYVFDAEFKTEADLNRDKIEYYGIHDVKVIKGIDIIEKYDLLFATRWDTAELVRKLPAKRKAYLVQDFEPWFNSLGDGTIAAENSYLYELKTITYGRWLALKLFYEYGNNPYYCDFATDLNTFSLTRKMHERLGLEPAICFIYQPEKPRRCPRLGIEALGIVKHFRPDVKLYFVGANEAHKLWYDYENLGILSTKQLNEVYNKCLLGFCISSSNPSCNPFDMMAAGLPVVDLYRENNLYDIPENGVLLAHQTPESIAEAILLILSDRERLISMSTFGVEFMKNRHVTQEVSKFIEAVDSILADVPYTFDPQNASSTRYTIGPVIAQSRLNSSVIQQFKYQRDKLSSLILSRQEMSDNNAIPIVAGATKFLDEQNLNQKINTSGVAGSLIWKLAGYLKMYLKKVMS